jgi:hypothetical protein
MPTEDFKNVPQELQKIPHWIVWRSEKRNGSVTKVPYAVNGGFAKSNDSSTWSTFESAVAVADDPLAFRDGVGFMLQGTNLVGLDFDGVRQDGVVDPYVLEIIKELGNPYTEITPSTTGLRMFVECAQLPKGNRKFSAKSSSVKKYGAEIYSGGEGGRYLTVTGHHYSGEGVPKHENIDFAYWLLSQFPNEKFKKLWMGDVSDYENDQSKGDLALCNILLKLLGPDKEKIDQYFRKSKLCDEKWMNRAEYREWTITKAMNRLPAPAPAPEQDSQAPPASAFDEERQELQFHLPAVTGGGSYDYVVAPADAEQFDGWFPMGSPSLIGGSSGSGKSTFLLDLLVKQAMKAPVFDHATFGRPYIVLMFDRGQESHDRTMRRMGFTTEQVPIKFLKPVLDSSASQEIINRIEESDPLPQVVFIEGLDMLVRDPNKMEVVMPFMHEMQKIASHFHIALIGSTGAPKTKANEGYTAKRDQIFGSAAWGRLSETIVTLQFPGGKDTADQRELTIMLRNGKPEGMLLEFQHGKLEKIPEQPQTDALSPKLREAVEFIEKALSDGGPKPSITLHDVARATRGIKKDTLEDAARYLKEQGLLSMRRTTPSKGKAQWVWELVKMNATGAALAEREPGDDSDELDESGTKDTGTISRDFDLS